MKYIRKSKGAYNIVRASKNYGRFTNPDDAVMIRDELVLNNWDLESLRQVYKTDGGYVTVGVIDDKVHILDKSKTPPGDEKIRRLYLKRLRNPNNSRYGLNITRIFDTFIIKKRIAGDDYIFGYYDNLGDAEFVRNYLMDHNWNVKEFTQVMHDRERSTYRVVEVIGDKVYVLDTFKTDDIDLDDVRAEFLNKIKKHKLKMVRYPHLEELTGKIPEIEREFSIKARDDMWDLDNADPLEVVFGLTPFQKSVYDSINHSTFEDIKKSMMRFKSKSFDEKIRKNIDELIRMDLIVENGEFYEKR